jgi:hypothetical protein
MAKTYVLSTRTRGPGTFISAQSLVPDGTTRVRLELDIPTADYEDTDSRVQTDLYKSFDGGATWQHDMGWSWEGGRFIDDRKDPPVTNPPPYLTRAFAGNDLLARWRCEMMCETRMKIGLSIELT